MEVCERRIKEKRHEKKKSISCSGVRDVSSGGPGKMRVAALTLSWLLRVEPMEGEGQIIKRVTHVQVGGGDILHRSGFRWPWEGPGGIEPLLMASRVHTCAS